MMAPIPRDPQQAGKNKRTRQFTEIVGQILNSLFRRGELERAAPQEWTVASALGTVVQTRMNSPLVSYGMYGG